MSNCNLLPTEDRLIVTKAESEEKTSGGILLPDSAKEKPQIGVVVKVGPGKTTDDGKNIPLNFKEQDKVVYAKYSGTEIKIGGIEYLILKASDILATVN